MKYVICVLCVQKEEDEADVGEGAGQSLESLPRSAITLERDSAR